MVGSGWGTRGRACVHMAAAWHLWARAWRTTDYRGLDGDSRGIPRIRTCVDSGSGTEVLGAGVVTCVCDRARTWWLCVLPVLPLWRPAVAGATGLSREVPCGSL